MKEFSIYIHIPFCLKKCLYCGFNSYEIPKGGKINDDYIDALITELDRTKNNFNPNKKFLRSIYLGGGTPSLLSVEQTRKILTHIYKIYEIDPPALEITLEINPGTADMEKLLGYEECGVNRFTLGVQSFLDRELRELGRIHRAVESRRLLEEIKSSRIKNYSLDLIYGIPGQRLKDWIYNLEQAVLFGPRHISAYNLTLEKNTPFTEKYLCGKLQLPGDETQLEMFKLAISTLARYRYIQYEISNFAIRGFESVHNFNYWKRNSYIGVGAGAHSFIKEKNLRYWNIKDPNEYIDKLRNNELHSEGGETLDTQEKRLEELFLSLRCAKGISLSFFREKKNSKLDKLLSEYKKSGYISIINGSLKLSVTGQFLSNEITEKLSYFI